jgi:outer membrane protein OmpA-like peptidoglycan-associated protein
MKKYTFFNFILPLLLLTVTLNAQQSSKSKSKDRFREKDSPENKVTVRNVTEINTKSTDYSPTFYQNGLVFASSSKRNGAQDKNTGETFSELYFAPFDPNGAPTARQNFSLDINSKLHEGPVTFSRNFKTMFYTQNNQKGGVQKADREGKIRLKIYEARKGQIDWIPKGELPFNSDDYSCVHPSLSADGKRLYFSSDMAGGLGGFDIYYSDKQADGTWGTPVNVPDVNTEKSELFPFIHPNGTLFFSSTGHESNLGGLDIFFLGKDSETKKPVVFNMDKPYNSPEDDLGFIINDELNKGFFTSNRKANEQGINGSIGKDDIWMFSIEQGIRQVRPTTREATIVITDGRTGSPVYGAEIRVLKSSGEGFVDTDSSVYDLDLQPSPENPTVYSMQLKPKSADKMRNADYHTDTKGNADADFLRFRSYMLLVNHRDYQMSQQLVSIEDEEGKAIINIKLNKAPDCHRASGTVLTDQLGTRIGNANIKFVHKTTNKTQTVRTNLNGEYDICLNEPGEYLVTVEKAGFLLSNYSFAAQKERTDLQEVRLRPTKIGAMPKEESPLANGIQNGSLIVLDKITYEPNQRTLNSTAIRALDGLFELMSRYPEMNIELIAHTDTRGNAATNLDISKERAENAQAYLEYRGIKAARIQTSGKGGTMPRNRCVAGVNCSDEEHLTNVRFEVKVSFSQP